MHFCILSSHVAAERISHIFIELQDHLKLLIGGGGGGGMYVFLYLHFNVLLFPTLNLCK